MTNVALPETNQRNSCVAIIYATSRGEIAVDSVVSCEEGSKLCWPRIALRELLLRARSEALVTFTSAFRILKSTLNPDILSGPRANNL